MHVVTDRVQSCHRLALVTWPQENLVYELPSLWSLLHATVRSNTDQAVPCGSVATKPSKPTLVAPAT
jgi:hypothetical protein